MDYIETIISGSKVSNSMLGDGTGLFGTVWELVSPFYLVFYF